MKSLNLILILILLASSSMLYSASIEKVESEGQEILIIRDLDGYPTLFAMTREQFEATAQILLEYALLDTDYSNCLIALKQQDRRNGWGLFLAAGMGVLVGWLIGVLLK